MSGTPQFEIPTEIHKMIERSLEQVRTTVAVLQRAAPGDVTGGSEVSNKVLNYAERNLANAFEFAAKLAEVRDLQVLSSLQVEFIPAQMQAMTEQAKELSEAMNKAMDSLKTSPKGSLSY